MKFDSGKPTVLIVLDGWGLGPAGPGNAITLAQTPNFDKMWAVYPKTQLLASGEAVGLPKREDGNSETGHLNLGAGHVVYQDLPRIDLSIADGSFFKIPAFKAAAAHVKKNNSSLQLFGLIGAGGVHSSLGHLLALLQFAKQHQIGQVFCHLFTDGRDSPPTSAEMYTAKIESEIKKLGVGKIASLCGRYFAMDRDLHWERTQKAYELLVLGRGNLANSSSEAVKRSYQTGKSDEFVEPVLLNRDGLVKDNDAIIFFNFRIDRPRQLTKAFVLPDFESLTVKKAAFDPYAEKYGLKQYQPPKKKTTTFKREKVLNNLLFVTMTEYEKELPVKLAFAPETVKMPLTRVISEKNLRQFHLAETEKERFVNYYFNGQREKPFPGEDRLEIRSPQVPTYDQKPEMSAYQLTQKLIKRINSNLYDFILVNFANPDMVGHTGVLKATIKACEVIDECLGKVVNTIDALGGTSVVTADHGNAEEMINLQTGEIDTEHSTNPVPLIIVNQKVSSQGKNLPREFKGPKSPPDRLWV